MNCWPKGVFQFGMIAVYVQLVGGQLEPSIFSVSCASCSLEKQEVWWHAGKYEGASQVCKWRRALLAGAVCELWKETNLWKFTQQRSCKELVRHIQCVVGV